MDTVECPVGHVRIYNNEPCPYCEIAQLRRELEKEKKRNSNTLYCTNCGLPQLGLGAACCKDDGQLSMTVTELVKELAAERKRADLNERALELACKNVEWWGKTNSPEGKADYFRKLAESK